MQQNICLQTPSAHWSTHSTACQGNKEIFSFTSSVKKTEKVNNSAPSWMFSLIRWCLRVVGDLGWLCLYTIQHSKRPRFVVCILLKTLRLAICINVFPSRTSDINKDGWRVSTFLPIVQNWKPKYPTYKCCYFVLVASLRARIWTIVMSCCVCTCLSNYKQDTSPCF